MSTDSIDRILEALLYEGYVLYPYRSDALKNRQRWNFGIVHPEGCNERSRVHTECIALGKDSVLNVELRFLQLQKRQACKLARPVCDPREITPDLLQPVDTVEAAGACYETWEEAVERTSPVHALDAKQLSAGAVNVEVTFGPESIVEPLPEKDGRITAALSRSTDVIRASTQVSAAEVADDLFKFSVSVNNLMRFTSRFLQNRDNILMRSLLSAHLILKLSGDDSSHCSTRLKSIRQPLLRALTTACGRCWQVKRVRPTACWHRRSSCTTIPELRPKASRRSLTELK